MLPAQYRMTRSAEFGTTVKHGVRAVQPDIVVHARRDSSDVGPRIGFVVTKAVGNAVERHRVTRRLRHAAHNVVADLDPADRIVIRALPSSASAVSARLQQEVRAGLRRARELTERAR